MALLCRRKITDASQEGTSMQGRNINENCHKGGRSPTKRRELLCRRKIGSKDNGKVTVNVNRGGRAMGHFGRISPKLPVN